MTDSEKLRLSNKLKKARRYFLDAEKEEQELFELIEELTHKTRWDLEGTETGAENADNVAQAIKRFLQHGECDTKQIIKEIEK